MRSLLPEFLSLVEETMQKEKGKTTVRLIDLGCGTGRNTLQLLQTISSRTEEEEEEDSVFQNAKIIGLDASTGMLDVARDAISSFSATRNKSPDVTLSQFDLLEETAYNNDIEKGNGMISTLVLEHIPLNTYFSIAANLLQPGAYFLVSNMHADMGRLSQAGFVDPDTKTKIRPMRSYAHEIGDVLAEAARAGFEIVPLRGGNPEVVERAVTEDILETVGQRAAKYVGVTVWFGVCFRKK